MNREEADKCKQLAKSAEAQGDSEKAIKFLEKAKRMDPEKFSANMEDNARLADLARLAQAAGMAKAKSQAAPAPEAKAKAKGKAKAVAAPAPVPKAEAKAKAQAKAKAEEGAQLREVQRILRTQDYHEILELPKTASENDVERAYRQCSRKTHPDKNRAPGAAEAFKKVKKAEECLLRAMKKNEETQCCGFWGFLFLAILVAAYFSEESGCIDKGWIGSWPYCNGTAENCIDKGYTPAEFSQHKPVNSTGFGFECWTGTKVRCQLGRGCSEANKKAAAKKEAEDEATAEKAKKKAAAKKKEAEDEATAEKAKKKAAAKKKEAEDEATAEKAKKKAAAKKKEAEDEATAEKDAKETALLAEIEKADEEGQARMLEVLRRKADERKRVKELQAKLKGEAKSPSCSESSEPEKKAESPEKKAASPSETQTRSRSPKPAAGKEAAPAAEATREKAKAALPSLLPEGRICCVIFFLFSWTLYQRPTGAKVV